mmetsp:Transcript_40588/g.95311  ORF Transcript_40588/g.95311 Transcript_40588/m.95311 type:complete len:152 (-) Transcript_40588:205-660(-)
MAQRALSILNLGIACLMVAAGVLTFIKILTNGDKDLLHLLSAVYMAMFGALLGSYEILWWMPLPWLNRWVRKNFGFLYGMRGKTVYLVFVAFLYFSLWQKKNSYDKTEIMTMSAGSALFINGLVHVVVLFRYKDLVNSYKAPSVGYDDDIF